MVSASGSSFTPAISADGRYVAYVSNESGRDEIYVQTFPSAGGGKWQVSSTGGQEPRWRQDGRELFYLSVEGKMMAVAVESGEKFFRPGYAANLCNSWIPALDGVKANAGLIATAVCDHPEITEILAGLSELGFHIALSSIKIDAIEAPILEVTDAQATLIAQRTAYYQALFDYQVALSHLKLATGR